MTMMLHDLAGAADDHRFSPYCWRVKMTLAHKGLEVETLPWRFTGKEAIAASGQGRVPVLVDGETLEAFTADREKHQKNFARTVKPLSMTLGINPFLGGDAPNFADYIFFGTFQWARCCSALQMVAEDDPITTWVDWQLALHDGFAGKARVAAWQRRSPTEPFGGTQDLR